jgi:non-homologous end joining protein Ku
VVKWEWEEGKDCNRHPIMMMMKTKMEDKQIRNRKTDAVRENVLKGMNVLKLSVTKGHLLLFSSYIIHIN